MLRIFFAPKIRRLRPGLNPWTWVPDASILTTRPQMPLIEPFSVEFVPLNCDLCRVEQTFQRVQAVCTKHKNHSNSFIPSSPQNMDEIMPLQITVTSDFPNSILFSIWIFGIEIQDTQSVHSAHVTCSCDWNTWIADGTKFYVVSLKHSLFRTAFSVPMPSRLRRLISFFRTWS
jgi:hypothetical protein